MSVPFPLSRRGSGSNPEHDLSLPTLRLSTLSASMLTFNYTAKEMNTSLNVAGEEETTAFVTIQLSMN